MSDIYLQITETPTVVTLSAPVISGALSSTVTVSNVVSVSVVTMPSITVQASAPAVTTVSGTVTIGNTVTIAGTVTANPTGTQTIAGTVTANVFGVDTNGNTQQIPVEIDSNGIADKFIPIGYNSDGDARQVSINYPLPSQVYGADSSNVSQKIATEQIGIDLVNGYRLAVGLANNKQYEFGSSYQNPILAGGYSSVSNGNIAFSVTTLGYQVVTISNSSLNISGSVTVGNSVTIGSLPAISGTVTANIANSVTIGSLPAISGTVTANNPNGTLTTRFGSVTTGGTSQLTACVTNSARKYLLCQNISTATVTIGIGFSPTTTQGIQLTAGAGLTFDSFVPTGAVYWLGATTGATFTILEG